MEVDGRVLLFREQRYGEEYHPTRAWGVWIVLICLLSLVIAAVTGIIPPALEPLFLFIWISGMLFGAILSFSGYLKSVDRQAYPVVIVSILTALIVVIIWSLTR